MKYKKLKRWNVQKYLLAFWLSLGWYIPLLRKKQGRQSLSQLAQISSLISCQGPISLKYNCALVIISLTIPKCHSYALAHIILSTWYAVPSNILTKYYSSKPNSQFALSQIIWLPPIKSVVPSTVTHCIPLKTEF